MALTDSNQVRETLTHIFPGITIQGSVPVSGQRLVYFCEFKEQDEVEAQRNWHSWGDVVLKLSEDIHPTVIARLEKEREILNALNSPFYPRLLYYDVFTEDPVTDARFRNRLFVTIEERVPGLSLAECRKNFSTERAVANLLERLVEGMSLLWLHPQRIIHRDLKPANILIRPDQSPVIIDLGIVREQGSAGVTGSHWNMGPCTPAYASPEQLQNHKRFITYKADFFSLGVIAYELLADRNPFMHSPHDPVEVVAHRALTETPPSLFSVGRASRGFSSLVERLIAKEPYKRPRTVADFSADLKRCAGEN